MTSCYTRTRRHHAGSPKSNPLCHRVKSSRERDQRLRDEPFELLLTDIVMPEMEGIELARRAAELDPDIKIMFITGFAAVALNSDSNAPKHAKVLSKPIHLRELVNEVQKMLAGERKNFKTTPCKVGRLAWRQRWAWCSRGAFMGLLHLIRRFTIHINHSSPPTLCFVIRPGPIGGKIFDTADDNMTYKQPPAEPGIYAKPNRRRARTCEVDQPPGRSNPAN